MTYVAYDKEHVVASNINLFFNKRGAYAVVTVGAGEFEEGVRRRIDFAIQDYHFVTAKQKIQIDHIIEQIYGINLFMRRLEKEKMELIESLVTSANDSIDLITATENEKRELHEKNIQLLSEVKF